MTDERISGLGKWLDTAVPVPERDFSEAGLGQAVLAGAERLARNRRRRALGSVALGVALVVSVGASSWMGQSQRAAIQFRVLPGTDLGRVGAYVAPTGDVPLDLKFTEGSLVELKPGARARVAATTALGATVLLETGRAVVDVVHRDRADWTVMAGPYSVRVHGTAFTVEFDPKTQLFELVMRSGVVSVEGPGISQPVEIRGAQRFVHRAGIGVETSETKAATELPPTTVGAESSAPTIGTESPTTNGRAVVPQVGSAPAGLTWETQVRRGEYSAVLREAERRGIPHVLSTATALEIMALANAARFSGRIDVGRDSYKALRQRFSGTPAATSAAFLMGRLMETSSPGEARRWYDRYEQEAPRGPLVAEAMGRRLLLTQTLGSRAEVQRLAEEYVRRFPDGPYAGVARKIVAP
jgi:transmembrane sensor